MVTEGWRPCLTGMCIVPLDAQEASPTPAIHRREIADSARGRGTRAERNEGIESVQHFLEGV